MSYTINEWPGRPPKHESYPWDKWMDGQIHILVEGEDYTVSESSMRSAIHNHARRAGVKARVTALRGDITALGVQFYDDVPPRVPANRVKIDGRHLN
jgi:hypothetical protein